MNPGICKISNRQTWLLALLLLCLPGMAQTDNNTLEPNDINAPTAGTIIIPVVVHVIYQNGEQNISDDQVRSQIAVLNKDFRKRNSDVAYIPAAFRDLAGDARIEFRLATRDPFGLHTTGITRHKTERYSFGLEDNIKFTSFGGTDGWNRDEYLNIWVGNLQKGTTGYSSLPGCEPAKDGVVIHYAAFGTTANVKSPYNRGRTAVHEIGHWLGLRHIWGDADCGDDGIEDTPPQQGPTRGCPSGVVSTCASGTAGNMYMNFMDFTNDACTNMFTRGQVTRMRSLFADGAARAAMLRSDKAVDADDNYDEPLARAAVGMYPNPAQNFVNITISGHAGTEAKIYTLQGLLIKRVRAAGTVTTINITDLASGTYMVKVGEEKAMKLIVN